MSFYIDATNMVPNEPSDIVTDISPQVFCKLNMLKASKPITCYKVLRRRKIGVNTSYYMAISNIEVGEDIIKDGNLLIANDEPKITVNRREYPNIRVKVDFGFISTFKNLDDAKAYAEYLKKVHSYKHTVIAKCLIEKGAVYCKGVDDFGRESYISYRVSITELLDE